MINFFVQICLMGTMFITSIYLQNVLQYNAFSTGLTLMPLSLLLFFTALVAVKVSQKVPPRFVVAFGSLCIFVGALYMYIMLSGGGMVTTVNNFGSSMSTSVIGSLFTGGIAGGILNAFIAHYPDTLASIPHEQAVTKLQAGFEKMKVMDITINDITADQAATLKDIIIHGVDNAMLPIFIIIMVMSILAAIVAAFLLKTKKVV